MDEKNADAEESGKAKGAGDSQYYLKNAAKWLALSATTIGGSGALFFILYSYAINMEDFAELLRTQVRAVVGIPMAAISSFCVVMVLEANLGPIEFEVLGAKFRGASGPVVLWIFGFLSFVLAIQVLWIG